MTPDDGPFAYEREEWLAAQDADSAGEADRPDASEYCEHPWHYGAWHAECCPACGMWMPS